MLEIKNPMADTRLGLHTTLSTSFVWQPSPLITITQTCVLEFHNRIELSCNQRCNERLYFNVLSSNLRDLVTTLELSGQDVDSLDLNSRVFSWRGS